MATKLSSLTLAFLESLAGCHLPLGLCLGLGSQRDTKEDGVTDVSQWDPLFYPSWGERMKAGKSKVGIGGEYVVRSSCPQGSQATSGPSLAGDLALWSQSRKPASEGALRAPETVALTLGCLHLSGPFHSGRGRVHRRKPPREGQAGVVSQPLRDLRQVA